MLGGEAPLAQARPFNCVRRGHKLTQHILVNLYQGAGVRTDFLRVDPYRVG
jgi:hypothetical protein